MRLWDYQLLPYLPKSQLLAQKRECDLIWKDMAHGRQTNHILINYIWTYKYKTERFARYYELLKIEFSNRGFKFEDKSFGLSSFSKKYQNPFPKYHNFRYLQQCFYNLQEKYDRGQKDFSKKEFDLLDQFVYGEWQKEFPL